MDKLNLTEKLDYSIVNCFRSRCKLLWWCWHCYDVRLKRIHFLSSDMPMQIAAMQMLTVDKSWFLGMKIKWRYTASKWNLCPLHLCTCKRSHWFEILREKIFKKKLLEKLLENY